jgi:hypothetical protein
MSWRGKSLTKEQTRFHLDAFEFLCNYINYRSAKDWDFEAIRARLNELEQQRGAAYPTS